MAASGHETNDAQTYADWGIDYLKYDKCQGALNKFVVMRDALRKTGRPIFYSINPGDQGPYCTPTSCSIDLVNIANMWRIEFDISANWDAVIRLIDKNKPEYVGAGPGHWNDPDMLEVGNGLNDTEGRAHFSMWAIMAAPLITGNDVSTMSTATKAILTNKEIIAVDQDPLGKQGRVVAGSGTSQEVWSKEMVGDQHARGRAVQSWHGELEHHRAVEPDWHSHRGGHRPRPLGRARSRLVHRLVHGEQCPESHRGHAQDRERALTVLVERNHERRHRIRRHRHGEAPVLRRGGRQLSQVLAGGGPIDLDARPE